MKRILLTLFVTMLAAISVRADVLFNEGYNYADGAITNVAAGTWVKHSGNAGADAFVINKRQQVGMARQDDVNRPFPAGYNATVTNIFASFTVNCTNLPTASNYFAHFITGTSVFHGRVWNAPGSLPG